MPRLVSTGVLFYQIYPKLIYNCQYYYTALCIQEGAAKLIKINSLNIDFADLLGGNKFLLTNIWRLLEVCLALTLKQIYMDIQLQISPTTAPLIKNALKERLEVVASELEFKQEELNRLENEKHELENQIKELDNAIMGTKSITNGYNPKATVLEKIKYVLTHSDQPLSSREISERLISIEPALGGTNKPTTFKNVSTLLSINKGEGKSFKRIEKEGEENKFTLNLN